MLAKYTYICYYIVTGKKGKTWRNLETPEIREALAKKIDAMTAAEKIKMIEELLTVLKSHN